MSKTCALCGKKFGFLSGGYTLKDKNTVCVDCMKKYNLNTEHTVWGLKEKAFKNVTSEQIREIVKDPKQTEAFKTKYRKTEDMMTIDERFRNDNAVKYHQWWIDNKKGFIYKKKVLLSPAVKIYFKDIRNIKPSVEVFNGGRRHVVRHAIAGDVIAGGLGSIIGASIGSDQYYLGHVGILINLKDGSTKEIVLNDTKLKIKSLADSYAIQKLNQLTNVIQAGMDKWSPKPASKGTATIDPAKEIKELADLEKQGIITKDEFEAKKKQLLGL